MEWEKKEEFGINGLLDEIEKASQVIVNQQLKDIQAQFKSLESMGIIPEMEKGKFSEIMNKMGVQLKDIENMQFKENK